MQDDIYCKIFHVSLSNQELDFSSHIVQKEILLTESMV